MPIKIETLYVNINFNIPGAIDRYLTRNLLYFPVVQMKTGGSPIVGGALSNYPYFTFDVKYPVDELKKLSREKLVLFFFDKNLFLNLLSGRDVATSPGQQFENGNYNITCMLGCMFPTSFPVPNNIQTSFDAKIEKRTSTSEEFNFSNEGTIFSYIQLGGSPYTVTKSLWINDIVNNKMFKRLLDELNQYNDWENKQKNELIKQIDIQKKKMIKVKDYFVKGNSRVETLKELKLFIDRSSNNYRSRDVLDNIKAKRVIPELERMFDEFFSNQNDIDKLVSVSMKIKKLIEKLGSYSDLIPREFLSIIKYAKLINSDKLILYVIEHPEYIKKVSKEMKEILGRYKNIDQIIKVLKDFSSPILNTSNFELQKLIDDFIKNKDSVVKNIKGFASYVRSLYILNAKNLTAPYSGDLLNIGVALSKLPFIKNGKVIKTQERRLEIQIQLDAFKGVITRENIKCIHRNAVLEKLYESLKLNVGSKETVELDKIRPYLDFDAIKPAQKRGGKSLKKYLNKINITRKRRV
jgi:hypothetical protein